MIALLATLALAAPEHAVGLAVGGEFRPGSVSAYAGIGAGPTWEVALDGPWDIHAEARFLLGAGFALLARGGAGLSWNVGVWRPGFGLDATLYWGAAIRLIRDDHPRLPPDVSPALQVRLDPVRFESGRFVVEALRIHVGSTIDDGRPYVALGFTLFELGVRL